MSMHSSYVVLALFFLILTGVVVFDCFRRRHPMKGIIADDVNLREEHLPDKFLYSLTNYRTYNKRVNPKGFCLVGYLHGNSMARFGLPDSTKVFCEKATLDDIKKGDILIIKILEAFSKLNGSKPEAKKYIGLWGKADQPDDDLKAIEGYEGSVDEYFTKVAPQRYGYPAPYSGEIEGFVKTFSYDQVNEKERISRPHDPKTIIARVKYAL